MIVVACSDQGEDNDLEVFGLGFHRQAPTFINAYCYAATKLVDRD